MGPKVTKARVVKLPVPGRNGKRVKVKGVIVQEGEEGVFPLERRTRFRASKEQTLDDGQCVLEEEQLEEAMEDGFESSDDQGNTVRIDDVDGALTLEETMRRVGAANKDEDSDDATTCGGEKDQGDDASSGYDVVGEADSSSSGMMAARPQAKATTVAQWSLLV